jgi:hypothetical protein
VLGAAAAGGGGNSLSFVAKGGTSGGSTSINAPATIVAGDTVIIGLVGFKGSSTASYITAVTESNGSGSASTFAWNTATWNTSQGYGTQFIWALSASYTGSVTYTLTMDSGCTVNNIFIMVFRKSGGAVTLDHSGYGAVGNGANPSSSNIASTSGYDVVLGLAYSNDATGFTSPLVGGAAAEQSQFPSPANVGMWETVYPTSQSNITVAATCTSSQYAIDAIAFKVE